MSEVKVWDRFMRKLANGDTAKLKIQNVPKGKEPEVIEFLCKYFIYEEVTLKSLGIADNEAALNEYKSYKLGMIQNNPTLICCVDNGDDIGSKQLEIVGCNLLNYAKRNENHKVQLYESEEMKAWFKMIAQLEPLCNIFDKYNVMEYLNGGGLSIDPAYRGCGIATKLLEARRPLCKDLGIAVTSAEFTAVASQRAAERAGYELVFQMDYKTFGDICGVNFDTDQIGFKIQALRIF